jgi:hypothetical protein
MGIASSEEKQYDAGRVEIYKCVNCDELTRFPRYK